MQTKNYGKNLLLRAKTDANLKLKVVRNTCDKKLGVEMNSANENYFKSSLENFQVFLF